MPSPDAAKIAEALYARHRLNEAAPDLLAAAQEIDAAERAFADDEDAERCLRALAGLRAAIAKATGVPA